MILHKVKNKIRSETIDFLIKLSLKLNYPKLAALAFALVVGKSDPAQEYTVLAIGRSIFSHDIIALEHFGKRINYQVIHLKYFHLIFDHFTAGPEKEKLTEENYHTHDYCQAGKKKYYLFLKEMFPTLKKLIGFDAIIAANFGYVAQQELARICQEKKLPFIVLHKEGIAVKDAYESYVNQFKNRRFLGAKILFYNDRIKNAFIQVGIDGMDESKMKVVGIPRLDFCFENQENKNQEKQVVFFSFFPRDKFTYQIQDENILNQVKKRSVEFHKTVLDFASRHPEIKLVIMTKMAPHYMQYVQGIFNKHFNKKLDNITMINSGDPLSLIKNSIAVIGFHSTTLIESIAVGRIIISPDFKDIIANQTFDYFEDYPEMVNYARTTKDLEEYIFNQDRYLNYKPAVRDKFLEEFISTPDGQACVRTEAAIIETINQFKT